MQELKTIDAKKAYPRKPEWLKIKPPGGLQFADVKNNLHTKNLHTVCEEAGCPNINECWNNGTATFLILGDFCTRSCTYCSIKTGRPLPADYDEPHRVAAAVKQMGVRHAVVTSVNRDDLPDGGAEIWALVIREIRNVNPGVTIEVLIPDFKGNKESLRMVVDAAPEILNHNIETVPRLFPVVRPQAKYNRSLDLLADSVKMGMRTKSGMMVGLGETMDEVLEVMNDLRGIGLEIFTVGQYLQPTKDHHRVDRYYEPSEFVELARKGLQMGFKHIESGPLVRSSYHAEKHL